MRYMHAYAPLTGTVRFTGTFYFILHGNHIHFCICLGGMCLYSLRWRWSLRASWMEACSQRAIVTSAMPSSSPSPSAPLTMRWVHLCSVWRIFLSLLFFSKYTMWVEQHKECSPKTTTRKIIIQLLLWLTDFRTAHFATALVLIHYT